MRIAVCEDNEIQREDLINIINGFGLGFPYELQGYQTGESLVDAYMKGGRYNIIFLDIQMEELDGIETAKRIREYDRQCIIIIVTSIVDYAVEGYGVGAFDFILKPLNVKKLEEVLNKALKELGDVNYYQVISRERLSYIKLSKIAYIESNGKKVLLITKDGTIESNENISSIEEKLDEMGFIRISRYFLVNMKYIKAIGAKSVLLKIGIDLNFSKKLRDSIKKRYMIYMMEGCK